MPDPEIPGIHQVIRTDIEGVSAKVDLQATADQIADILDKLNDLEEKCVEIKKVCDEINKKIP